MKTDSDEELEKDNRETKEEEKVNTEVNHTIEADHNRKNPSLTIDQSKRKKRRYVQNQEVYRSK